MPIITEDETDEILYLARANEIQEFKTFIPTLFPKYGTQPAWILSQAVDAETGNSALHYAGANGHVDMATHILTLIPTPAELTTFVNKQNTSGNTALHWAALNGHLDLAKLLLSKGADAGILNFSGHDAVYEAEVNDKQDVAEWLLKEAIGLERGIGREGSGLGEGSGSADADEQDIVVSAGDMSAGPGTEVQEADRVADGMRGMEIDAKGGAQERSPG